MCGNPMFQHTSFSTCWNNESNLDNWEWFTVIDFSHFKERKEVVRRKSELGLKLKFKDKFMGQILKISETIANAAKDAIKTIVLPDDSFKEFAGEIESLRKNAGDYSENPTSVQFHGWTILSESQDKANKEAIEAEKNKSAEPVEVPPVSVAIDPTPGEVSETEQVVE